MSKVTLKTLRNMKSKGEKISALTCYTYFNSRIFNDVGIDVLLVGDSLGNVRLGYETTLPVTIDDIVYHLRMVKRGNSRSLLAADMPFMSYEASNRDAVFSAGRLVKEGGAEAVKLEGGEEIIDRVKAINKAGIPVIGHIGLLPQSVHKTSGYRVHGKDKLEAEYLKKSAVKLESAGVCAIVLECIPESLGKSITETVSVPTIGIGAGRFCDGQILVFEDIVGMHFDNKKKIVKQYDDFKKKIIKVVTQYNKDIKMKKFPNIKNIFK